MKKSVLISALALTVFAFADADVNVDSDVIAAAQKMNGRKSKQEMKEMKEKEKKKKMMMDMVTLTSARPESDNGWYLFGDALYWHADVGNADWSERTESTASTDYFKVHQLDFKWNWGFKAGIGVNMDHDMWDSSVMFTWFETSNSNTVRLSGKVPVADQNITTFLPAEDMVVSSKHHWSIHYGMFDWMLGRWQYYGKSLAMRPFVGVKGGWINQYRNVRLLDEQGVNRRGYFKNDFWGVGPSAGMNTMWILGSAGSNMDHRFSLCGDFAGSLMYGHFRNKYTVHATDNTQKIKHLNRNLAVPMLQAMLGLSWDTAFNEGHNHFMFKVGYEFQYWFRQNQFLSLKETPVDGLLGAIRYSDDLALQGVTGEFRFDF